MALNFSVFKYEVLNDKKQACELGEQALTDALEKIDDVEEDVFRDAKSIIELLKENLSLWKEEEDENHQVEDLWKIEGPQQICFLNSSLQRYPSKKSDRCPNRSDLIWKESTVSLNFLLVLLKNILNDR